MDHGMEMDLCDSRFLDVCVCVCVCVCACVLHVQVHLFITASSVYMHECMLFFSNCTYIATPVQSVQESLGNKHHTYHLGVELT